MADRSKKKGSVVKGGAAANPAAMEVVESHKDDTAVLDAQVETNPEAEKAEGEVKSGGEAKVEETVAEQNEEPTVQVDPEFEREQQRAARKSSLKLRFYDNPVDLMTSDLSDEDRELIAELVTEQGQVVKDYSVTTEQLAQEKDIIERKLDATNSKLGDITGLIATTVKETMGQVDNATATAIEGLKTSVEQLSKNNGVKNAISTIGDQIAKDIGGLKGKFDGIKSVESKVDEVGKKMEEIDSKVSKIKSSSSSSHWPWVAVVGLLLAAVTVIAVFLLTQDTKIEVQVVPQPATGSVKNVVPPAPSNAGVTSQQATPGGPSNLLAPIVVGATPENPCEGTTGGALGECVMTKLDLRPKDMVESDWKVVTNFFKEVIPTALEGFRACEEKYLRADGDADQGLECQQAVKCLAAPADEAKRCWRVGAESFGQRLSSN